MDVLRGALEEASPESYEELFLALGRVYNEFMERMMNLSSGGEGGRPLPDMEGLLDRVKEFQPEFVE